MDNLVYIAIAIGFWIVILVSVYVGYRMGRDVAGYPGSPIITPRQPVEEDPYWKPMYGEGQPSYPTIDDRMEGKA